MPINPIVVNKAIDTASDKVSNFYDRLYQTPIGKWVDHNLMNDSKLSDEEYVSKYGYGRPNASAGLLEFLSPEGAAKLGKLGKELKAVEEVRNAQKLKDLNILKNADNVRVSKTGRTRFTKKPVYTKENAVPVMSSGAVQKAVTPIVDDDAYMNALRSAQNASEMGLDRLANLFYEDASFINKLPVQKSGGKLKRKC